MEFCFAFPGQGSQKAGMGVDIHAAFGHAVKRFDEADGITGRSISALCFDGPEEDLKQTENTQPALFVVEAIIADILRERGIVPAVTMGHSLGEYAALYAAGFFSFADGVRLVSERGRLMAGAGETAPGAMAAIIGLSRDAIAESLSSVTGGTVVCANENTPQQTVISGEKQAVEEACAGLKAAGAKRAVPLPVSGAFHSPLMRGVADEFAPYLSSIEFTEPRCPVISNVSAREETDPARVKKLLIQQLVSPVRWVESVGIAASRQDITVCEIGPGSVLQGLIRKIDPSLRVVSCGSAENIYSLSST